MFISFFRSIQVIGIVVGKNQVAAVVRPIAEPETEVIKVVEQLSRSCVEDDDVAEGVIKAFEEVLLVQRVILQHKPVREPVPFDDRQSASDFWKYSYSPGGRCRPVKSSGSRL